MESKSLDLTVKSKDLDSSLCSDYRTNLPFTQNNGRIFEKIILAFITFKTL